MPIKEIGRRDHNLSGPSFKQKSAGSSTVGPLSRVDVATSRLVEEPPDPDAPEHAPGADFLQQNLRRVRERIDQAARRASRDPQDTTLVAVTKAVESDIIERLVHLGAFDLGENRIQVAEPKIQRLRSGLSWHLIGHLQSNKARRAVALFSWIHAVDSVSLFDRLEQAARDLERRPKVLIQVHVSGEESKFGVSVDQLPVLLERAARAEWIEPVGLMTMAPTCDLPEETRPHFRMLRELLLEERSSGRLGPAFGQLSMGMSSDFEIAVEEGATLVRVGTALFQAGGA